MESLIIGSTHEKRHRVSGRTRSCVTGIPSTWCPETPRPGYLVGNKDISVGSSAGGLQ